MPIIFRSGRTALIVATALLTVTASRTAKGQQPVLPADFEDVLVASVQAPTSIAALPDSRLLVGSQLGQVYLYSQGQLTTALDFGSASCAYRERGLSGLAVDPEFSTNRFVYVAYMFNKFGSCDAESGETPVGRVSRFVLTDGGVLDRGTERILLDNIPSPIGVHNLGDVEFGKDGYLYVTVGDGGCDYAGNSGCFDSNNAAQDLNALVGKVLRITRDGDIPPDNPFTGAGTVRCHLNGVVAFGMTCQEIFAFGLRNPWRIAFDPNAPLTRFFINDVGQDTWEEINEAQAGANYGWNEREGFCARGTTTDCAAAAPPGLTNPIFAYGREEGCASVTGGAFVPGGLWPAAFDGVYLYSDFICGGIFRLVRASDGTYSRESFVSGLGDGSAVELLFAPDGAGTALYYITYMNGGQLRRISFVGDTNRQPVAAFTVSPEFGPAPLTVYFDATGSSDADGDSLTFSWDFGDGSSNTTGLTVQHQYSAVGTYIATLRVTDGHGGESTVSSRIDVGNTPPQPAILTPTEGHQFAVGDTVVLEGQAQDAEDGALADSALSWHVLLHHNTHTHNFLPPTPGNRLEIRAPPPENLEAAATSYLEVQLTATDSRGLSRTVSRAARPLTARMDFLTDPPGALLRIDDGLVRAPATFTSWVNYGVSAEAPAQTGPDGTPLVFASWSDGGGAAHQVVTPSTPSSYTARFTTGTTSGGGPFNGVAMTVPGTIEAENFDEGGSGIAFLDNTAANFGGVYRTTAVDIEPTLDAGGGHNVGWAFAGEWLGYTVDVTTAGVYDIEVRVASNGTGGTFHLEVDGEDKTGTIAVPDTGGWQTWTTLRIPGVNLAGGRQVWRLVMDANGGTTAVGNFNHLRVAASTSSGSTAFEGTPASLPGTIEAENFDEGGDGVAYADTTPGNSGGQYRSSGVDIEPAADAGDGYNVGWIFAGEWLTYTVDAGTAGTFDVEIRVASAGPGGAFHIEVDGVDKTGPLTVPNTGGWQTWTTVRVPDVSLNAGRQVWRVVMDANGATTAVGNINWIRVVSSTDTLVRGPYLQQVRDTGAIVVWATRQPGAAQVRHSVAGGGALSAQATTHLYPATLTGLGFDYYQHEAELTGLSPGSSYTYDILADGVDLIPARQDALRTAPPTGTGSIQFIAFGDSGVGSTPQRQLAARMTADSFDLAIHTGDVVYGAPDGVGPANYQQLDDWLFQVYDSWLRVKPFFPSIGNHDDEIDSARPYRDMFVLPENGETPSYADHAERYYSFDYGPVHFVALDTELAFADAARRQAQLAWLDADLQATTQPWRVVYFHRPPYSSGGHHGSDLAVRQAFAPVFERHGVQLVISGHEHSYERSVPLREHVPTGSAVTYIVTGGGGAPTYPSGQDRWTAASADVHHYVRASVGDCVLRIEAVSLDGAVFDSHPLDRCEQARDAGPPQVSIGSPTNGAAVSGIIDVLVSATDDVRVEKVDLYVDGVFTEISKTSPYGFRLDTSTLANGMHVLQARAYDPAGRTTASAPVSVTTSNTAPARDVVLYASDVSVAQGNWSRLSSTTGAGGLKMTSADRGESYVAAPLATPADYFEATFDARAGAYRVWLRLRGAADSKFNESVWVQFSDATDANGAPLWPIGSESALLVNLEDCGACGISGWGWQDNAWWLGESSVVRFTAGGTHRIRIQTREDGVDVDQIVLSPVTFFGSPPGPVLDDQTIVPK